MADLTANDVTITYVNTYGGGHRTNLMKRRTNQVNIAFGDGVKTYPAGGVPMPAKGSFGLVRFLESLVWTDDDDTQQYIYKWDQTNNKIRIWVPNTGAELGNVAVAATNIKAQATGW